MKTIDLFNYDKELRKEGYRYICGIDEAGRGPLAGPVSVCAVIMDLDEMIDGVNDSKKVSPKKRDLLYDVVREKALSYKCVMLDSKVIDEINILEATKKAMKEAVQGLSIKPDLILVDAVKIDFGCETRPIIKGDATSYSIASASIIAKVARDRLMEEYDNQFPGYGFAKHKGYGTKDHINAIKTLGPTPIHRRTFIGNFVNE